MLSLLAEANHKVGETECNTNFKIAEANHLHLLSKHVSKSNKSGNQYIQA